MSALEKAQKQEKKLLADYAKKRAKKKLREKKTPYEAEKEKEVLARINNTRFIDLPAKPPTNVDQNKLLKDASTEDLKRYLRYIGYPPLSDGYEDSDVYGLNEDRTVALLQIALYNNIGVKNIKKVVRELLYCVARSSNLAMNATMKQISADGLVDLLNSYRPADTKKNQVIDGLHKLARDTYGKMSGDEIKKREIEELLEKVESVSESENASDVTYMASIISKTVGELSAGSTKYKAMAEDFAGKLAGRSARGVVASVTSIALAGVELDKKFLRIIISSMNTVLSTEIVDMLMQLAGLDGDIPSMSERGLEAIEWADLLQQRPSRRDLDSVCIYASVQKGGKPPSPSHTESNDVEKILSICELPIWQARKFTKDIPLLTDVSPLFFFPEGRPFICYNTEALWDYVRGHAFKGEEARALEEYGIASYIHNKREFPRRAVPNPVHAQRTLGRPKTEDYDPKKEPEFLKPDDVMRSAAAYGALLYVRVIHKLNRIKRLPFMLKQAEDDSRLGSERCARFLANDKDGKDALVYLRILYGQSYDFCTDHERLVPRLSDIPKLQKDLRECALRLAPVAVRGVASTFYLRKAGRMPDADEGTVQSAFLATISISFDALRFAVRTAKAAAKWATNTQTLYGIVRPAFCLIFMYVYLTRTYNQKRYSESFRSQTYYMLHIILGRTATQVLCNAYTYFAILSSVKTQNALVKACWMFVLRMLRLVTEIFPASATFFKHTFNNIVYGLNVHWHRLFARIYIGTVNFARSLVDKDVPMFSDWKDDSEHRIGELFQNLASMCTYLGWLGSAMAIPFECVWYIMEGLSRALVSFGAGDLHPAVCALTVLIQLCMPGGFLRFIPAIAHYTAVTVCEIAGYSTKYCKRLAGKIDNLLYGLMGLCFLRGQYAFVTEGVYNLYILYAIWPKLQMRMDVLEVWCMGGVDVRGEWSGIVSPTAGHLATVDDFKLGADADVVRRVSTALDAENIVHDTKEMGYSLAQNAGIGISGGIFVGMFTGAAPLTALIGGAIGLVTDYGQRHFGGSMHPGQKHLLDITTGFVDLRYIPDDIVGPAESSIETEAKKVQHEILTSDSVKYLSLWWDMQSRRVVNKLIKEKETHGSSLFSNLIARLLRSVRDRKPAYEDASDAAILQAQQSAYLLRGVVEGVGANDLMYKEDVPVDYALLPSLVSQASIYGGYRDAKRFQKAFEVVRNKDQVMKGLGTAARHDSDAEGRQEANLPDEFHESVLKNVPSSYSYGSFLPMYPGFSDDNLVLRKREGDIRVHKQPVVNQEGEGYGKVEVVAPVDERFDMTKMTPAEFAAIHDTLPGSSGSQPTGGLGRALRKNPHAKTSGYKVGLAHIVNKLIGGIETPVKGEASDENFFGNYKSGRYLDLTERGNMYKRSGAMAIDLRQRQKNPRHYTYSDPGGVAKETLIATAKKISEISEDNPSIISELPKEKSKSYRKPYRVVPDKTSNE